MQEADDAVKTPISTSFSLFFFLNFVSFITRAILLSFNYSSLPPRRSPRSQITWHSSSFVFFDLQQRQRQLRCVVILRRRFSRWGSPRNFVCWSFFFLSFLLSFLSPLLVGLLQTLGRVMWSCLSGGGILYARKVYAHNKINARKEKKRKRKLKMGK